MKKIKVAGLLLSAFALTSLASCDEKTPVDPEPTPEVVKNVVTFETNGGSSVEKIEVEVNGKVVLPANPTKENHRFEGWFTDSACTVAFDANTSITENITLYAKWQEVGSYSVDFNEHGLGYTLDDSYKVKNVTILKGCVLAGDNEREIDGKSYVRIKTDGAGTAVANIASSKAIQIKIFGKGTVKMWVAASGSDERTFKVTNSNKKVVYTKTVSDTNLFEVELELEEATTLYAFGDNGFDFYKVDTEWEIADKGTVTGIEVSSPGSNKFIEGEEFDTTGLEVIAIYDSGYEEPLLEGTEAINYSVDSSEFDKSTPGYYPITVKYNGFEAEYNAYVYDIKEFNVDLFYMFKDSENIWGNGALRNVNTRQVNFGSDATFDTSALTVSILGEVKNEKNKTLTRTFKLSDHDYTLECDYKNETDGSYKVTVKTAFGNGEFYTYVVKTAPVIVENTVTARVNKEYTGVIGAVNANNEHMFTDVTTAVEYLTYHSSITDDMKKVLYVDAGKYKEKVDVDIPNFTLIGAGRDKTIITYDAANGLQDPRGTMYGTDGSCTFGVRSTATNFTAMNITFDSYYNNLERFNALKAVSSGTQALAIMVQADRAAFYQCGFTGFQDTIEMQGAGRQYFYKCFVSGATDYIFGTNSSALFEDCEILTITNGQKNNGGYITAPKGLNKGGDYTAFGYIFNNCQFTNDGETTTNTTSLGRAWDNGASITIMNSFMDYHIATAAFDGESQARRLAAGLNGDWTSAMTLCREYNNTGSGAITEDQVYAKNGKTTVDVITEAEANKLLTDFWGSYEVLVPNNEKYNFTATPWTKPVFE